MRTETTNRAINAPIDPDFINMIVRKVIARLQSNTGESATTSTGRVSDPSNGTGQTATVINNNVITADVVAKITGQPKQIFVGSSCVITPAAKDAAKARGIEINRSSPIPSEQQPRTQPNTHTQSITDSSQPERASSIQQQLTRRGISNFSGMQIVLSDTPAVELHRCISQAGCKAAMVGDLADVERFFGELQPTAWVLDMKRLNFIAAVNVAAKIAQLGNPSR